MKKRGFTLIELLAVIVVLAIIALIATPIVMNVIKKASAGAAERSADNYVKAVETLIATEKLGEGIEDGKYTIDSTGKITLGEKSYTVEVSGTKPVGGEVTITNGQVDKSKTKIEYTDYTVKFEDGVAEATEKGDVVVLCRKATQLEDGVGVLATPEHEYDYGVAYDCELGDGETRRFFVLEDGDATELDHWNGTDLITKDDNVGTAQAGEVALIMNKNFYFSTAWAESMSTTEGPVTANSKLPTNWDSSVQVTLPTYSQINAVKAANSDTLPMWLYDYLGECSGDTSATIHFVDCEQAYWTATSMGTEDAYMVSLWNGGSLGSAWVGDGGGDWSVRPVITILKEQIG